MPRKNAAGLENPRRYNPAELLPYEVQRFGSGSRRACLPLDLLSTSIKVPSSWCKEFVSLLGSDKTPVSACLLTTASHHAEP